MLKNTLTATTQESVQRSMFHARGAADTSHADTCLREGIVDSIALALRGCQCDGIETTEIHTKLVTYPCILLLLLLLLAATRGSSQSLCVKLHFLRIAMYSAQQNPNAQSLFAEPGSSWSRASGTTSTAATEVAKSVVDEARPLRIAKYSVT